MKKLVPQSLRNIYHLFQAILANLWFGFPSKNMKVIGVTGTNGKTTVCQMITAILEEAGYKVAMASTINFKIGKVTWVNKTKFTTLSSWKIQQFIKNALKEQCQYLVLETSSHALDQNRVWGVQYRTAVITNITREHLDYHRTMDNYRQAKLGLFKRAEVAVINLDMEKPEDFLELNYEKTLTYSLNNNKADVLAQNIETGLSFSSFTIQNEKFICHLLGKYNVENALAAIATGIAENIKIPAIKSALEKIKEVPGRLEFIANNKGFNIIIDYAVTPDSLSKLYTLIKQINTKKTKIIAVFGACGERDRGKRPIMGEIVSHYADHIILTNEDPYGENPEKIIDEIQTGIKNKNLNQNFWKILDRREAIKKALLLVKPGDYIVVTGKGAEETMALGRKRVPWNDRKVIQELLSEI
jgi:UDP-N-acetylmuramoyl-L-alanyl-D-glutamate--2,6-diaminopimelate ligase